MATSLLYAHVTGAPFCGYDDFNEAYRAAFFDARLPSRIITATHFTPFMYRPVTSALQLETWQLFGHNPLAFRLRNLAMHLIAVAMVYGIAFLLQPSRKLAVAAAALFAFNPLANQAVVVAIWTNTTAYALLLAAFFSFLLAVRAQDAGRAWVPALVASLALVPIALFTYEPTIVVFGMMAAYLVLWRSLDRGFSPAFLVAFLAGSAFDLVLFFGIRHVVGVSSAGLLPLREIAHNTGEYLIALALPVDPVLASALFRVPLPFTDAPISTALLIATSACALAYLVVVGIAIRGATSKRLVTLDWRTIVFLLVSIPIALVPILLYKAHVSEFNLYVPAALYAIALASVLNQLCRNRMAFGVVVGLLLVSYVAGTSVRNGRVIACAHVVSKIIVGLPVDAWRNGAWNVRLATPPEVELTAHYGIYNYSGIETIEVPNTGIKGAQDAIRLATGNDGVSVAVVAAEALRHDCSRPRTCYYVFPDGSVEEVRP